VRTSRVAAVVVAALLAVSTASAGELQDDLKARRARALAQLQPDSLLVLFSAPVQTYSHDVEYEFRQDSTLQYLTGVDQEETILVMMPGNRTQKEILFVREPDPRREHWEGHSLTLEEARAQSGIDVVYHTPQFDTFLTSMMTRRPYGFERRSPDAHEEFATFFDAVAAGRAKLTLLLQPPPTLSGPLPAAHEFAKTIRDRFFGIQIADATDVLWRLRQIKTPYEQKTLTRSLEISSEAHRAGMRTARPGAYEYEVESAIEAVYLRNGAMTPGYPSIVGSGPNSTILHYSKSSRRMEAGDMLLVDAAGSYQYLTGDITRTYPVSGRFSALQKEIYTLVFDAQEAGIRAARAGNRPADIENASADVVRKGLLKLGLITDASGEQFRTWYTHGIVHYIGMDVHDVGDRNRPLEPGMAFVIEPGIYIREEALAALPDTPKNRAFIEAVRPAVAKYKNIGVRIEDSFLLTETGLTRLSASVPRSIEEIETFMRPQPTSAQDPQQ
jgi:Xaa-Pro aminopeptidase